MNNAFRITLLGMLGILLTFTGCASKKKNQRLNALEAQMGEVTNELVRLDQSIQETRASIQNAPSQGVGSAYRATAGSSGSIYRTPSGFELPSTEIQQALRGAGYYQGDIDGKIGPATRDAVKAFQRDNGLEPDGVIGRRTWGKLKTYLTSAVK